MATGTNFPTSLDSFVDKVDGVDDILSAETNTQSSALEAIQAKVGIDSSADTSSYDYIVNQQIIDPPTNGYVLTANDALTNGIEWAANPAGFADPLTTRGDIMIRNASNNTARLGIGTSGQTLKSDGTDISWGAGYNPGVVPSLTGAVDTANLTTYLGTRHTDNANVSAKVGTYIDGYTPVAGAFIGGVYSPTEDKIYPVPYFQADEIAWYYIDCNTGGNSTVVQYTSGVTAVNGGYAGGAYSPNQNRIYFSPNEQADEINWHYIDCNTGKPTAYAHGATVVNGGYYGAAYSPTQDRLYFIPALQGSQTDWHYVNCNTGGVVAYAHGATVAAGSAYFGGVYSPTQDRIYLVPYAQADEINWHYIDCSDGSVNAYAHGATVLNNGYIGGAYSPTQDRIYLVPQAQSNQADWHYIDCSDGSVNAYTHGATVVANGYAGGMYMPTLDRIYLAPEAQANQTDWHYIDCSDGSVNAYANGVDADIGITAIAYHGMVYSPRQDRAFFIPRGQAPEIEWHYVQGFSEATIAPQLAAHAMFNKF